MGVAVDLMVHAKDHLALWLYGSMAIYLIFVIYMQQRYSFAKIAKNHATYLIDYRRKVGVSIDAQEGYIKLHVYSDIAYSIQQ